jgi:hypothetical protein
VAEQAAADGRRAKLANPKDEAHAAKPTGEHGVPNQHRQDGAEAAVAAVSTVGAAPPAVQASAAAPSHKRWITSAKLVRISCRTSRVHRTVSAAARLGVRRVRVLGRRAASLMQARAALRLAHAL